MERLTHLDDDKKIIWAITVNHWTGEVLDLEIKVIDKITVIGNTGNGDNTSTVYIYPKKSEHEECGFDKEKVIDMIKDKSWYEREIIDFIHKNRLIYKDFAQK